VPNSQVTETVDKIFLRERFFNFLKEFFLESLNKYFCKWREELEIKYVCHYFEFLKFEIYI
jgi:hypothetical protein